MKSIKKYLGAILLCSILPTHVLHAQQSGGDGTVLKDYYSTPGLTPFETRLSDQFNESISPFNGVIQLIYTDMSIPGNGGLDINIVRTYTSVKESLNTRPPYGYGWDISFGKLKYNFLSCTDLLLSGGASTRDNPIFTTQSGSTELLVKNDGSMSGATDALLVSKGRYSLKCETGESGSVVPVVYGPDGRSYEMGFSPYILNEQVYSYVTKVSDRNGNSFKIDYDVSQANQVHITQVYDQTSGRTVNFNYDVFDHKTLRSISSHDRSVNYQYENVTEYNEAAGALDTFEFYPDYPSDHLTSVIRPNGTKWNYEYHVETPIPDVIAGYERYAHLLKSVQSPYGELTTYEYQDVYFGDYNQQFYTAPQQVIKSKRYSGGDVGIYPSANRFWEYEFLPGQGYYSGSSQRIGDVTIIKGPDKDEYYLHYGFKLSTRGELWKIGLLLQREIRTKSGVTLYTETNEWLDQEISSENYWNGRDPNYTDYNTKVALLSRKTIFQEGVNYLTDYSSYDAYGNAQSVIESGSKFRSQIPTTEQNSTFYIDTDKWIVNQLEDETITDVGTIDREYDANGNLAFISKYGLETSYEYTSEGDLAQTIDPYNRRIYYYNYSLGVPRLEQYPHGKEITRTVDLFGNILSESDGRGYITGYTYNKMDRVTSIDYPIHSDVTITYQTGPTLTRTLQRGSLTEVTYFSQRLKPIKSEKIDVTTGQVITAMSYYDIHGRKTFTSLPSYSGYDDYISNVHSVGTVTEYDPLGRVTKINHPDGTRRIFNYPNISHAGYGTAENGTIDIYDENEKLTTHDFYGVGSPGNKRLGTILSPENVNTSIYHNRLGMVTSVWQGERGGTGYNRSYNFNSKMLLESEDHPEVGHIVYTYDLLGNMLTKQIKNSLITDSDKPDSGITRYYYDAVSRIRLITYPSAPNIDYEYDNDDRVAYVGNSTSWTRYFYDENGNLTNEDVYINNVRYPVTYGINSLDYIQSMDYPSGRSVHFSPDSFGRSTIVGEYVNTVQYHPGGQISNIAFSNGVNIDYSLNERHWISSIQSSGPGDLPVSLQYSYDGKANVLQIDDAPLNINNRVMGYDGVDRLTSASGMWGAGLFTYDHKGNLSTREIAGDLDSYTVQDGQMLQMLKNGQVHFTPAYDVYGNQLKSDRYNFTFNDASQLVAATPGVGVVNAPSYTFGYDGKNRRVFKTSGSSTTHYVYNKADQVIAEIDVNQGIIKDNFYLGSMKVASRTGNEDPVALITVAGTVQEKQAITLDGTESYDVDGSIVQYQWRQVSGPSIDLINSDTPSASFEAPFVVQSQTASFELTVTDDSDNIGSDVISITIEKVDTDNDGLSDGWEEIYFPGNLSVLSGGGDYDRDGLTDAEEFELGSNPATFDLDTPINLSVTTDYTSTTLAWTEVPRADRYAVYWSDSSSVIPLSENNRFYTSGSPFLHDDLQLGSHFYYMVVAEKVDSNGAFIGSSDPSGVIHTKVGWNYWSNKVLLANTQQADGVNLEVSSKGDALVTWPYGGVGTDPGGEGNEGDIRTDHYSKYTRGTGWSSLADLSQEELINGGNIRVREDQNGFYASIFDESTDTWGAEILIFDDPNDEWSMHHVKFNKAGDGLVIIEHESTDALAYIHHSSTNGFGSAEPLQISLPGGYSAEPIDLFMDKNGNAKFLFYEYFLDTTTYTRTEYLGVIDFHQTNGWSNQIRIFPDNIYGVIEDLLIQGNSAGQIFITWHRDSAGTRHLYSKSYDPVNGWGAEQLFHSFTWDSSNYRLDYRRDMVLLENGLVHFTWIESLGFMVNMKSFTPGLGWGELVQRNVPRNCDYDYYPAQYADDVDGWGGPHSANSGDIDTSRFFRVRISIEASLDNQISIVTSMGGKTADGWREISGFTTENRYEPSFGWMEPEVLLCPFGMETFGVKQVLHEMNEYGATFVSWNVYNIGDLSFQLQQLLVNQFDILKGLEPQAHAGVDQTVVEGETVTLDGSQSVDVDNGIKTYHWKQLSGPNVNIVDLDAATASFIAPLVDAETELRFMLTITDLVGNQNRALVTVTVSDFSSSELGATLSLDKVSPVIQGEVINLSALAAGGTGSGYEYLYRIKQVDTDTDWSILKDFDEVSSYTLNTSALNGKYKIQLQLREIGHEAVVVNDTASIWINSIDPVLSVSLSTDLSSPQLANRMVTLSASPGSAIPTEYQFQIRNPLIQEDWITVRDYSVNPDYIWDTAAYVGKNSLRVLSRKAGSQDKVVKDKQSFWVNDISAVTGIDLVPDVLSPQTTGTTITFATSIVGGNGNSEYQFSVKPVGLDTEWQIAQAWTAVTTFVWDTQNLYGKYRIKVEARNVGSNDKAVVAKQTFWLNAPDSLQGVTLSSDQLSPQIPGSIVNFSAAPTDTISINEFQFELKTDSGGDWQVIQPYSSNNTMSFDTSSYAGKNKIRVVARRQGTVDKVVKDKKVMWVNQPNPITAVSIDSDSDQLEWGDTLSLNINLTGGDSNQYYYVMDVKVPGQDYIIDTWFESVQRDEPITWSVGTVSPGEYKIRLRVVNALTDKPVKSNGYKFTVLSTGSGGGGSGSNQSCDIYDQDCYCEFFLNCGTGSQGTGNGTSY